MNEFIVFDVESDGLLDEATKIHCMSFLHYKNGSIRRFSYTSYEDMRNFFTADIKRILVGHNIIRYDIPLIEKILGIKINSKIDLYDTLALSWYLFPEKLKHGLEAWGIYFGVKKPEIEDWENLTIQDYLHRCQEDVEINVRLFDKCWTYLNQIYNTPEEAIRLVKYLGFKLDCAREQEEEKWKLDLERCQIALDTLLVLEKEKVSQLSSFMPKNIIYKEVKKPAKMFKKDGSLSAIAERWFETLEKHGLPLDTSENIKIKKDEEDGNPKSHKQLKEWLFTLGWIPETFSESKATGENIPQVSLPQGQGICDSVKHLYQHYPYLENLEGLYVISHRIGILKGFLKNVNKDGMLEAKIKGFTNTLRFQHTILVNLPTPKKPYSKDIRSCLIASDDNHILCGSDMSSLEDSTKQHYMYFFDPEYVTQMRVPGFDPHLDIAMFSKLLTEEEVNEHKLYDKTEGKEGKDHSEVRKKAKVVNFSGVYGAGPPKIAKTLGCDLEFAKTLHKAYWERNKAVKLVAKSIKTKRVKNSMWLFNPVSRFWYSLRDEKDIFSTLNQGTGVYCFDTWVKFVRASGIKVIGQFHDEIIVNLPKDKQEYIKATLLGSIERTNQVLKLNVPLGISIDFGDNYAEIH